MKTWTVKLEIVGIEAMNKKDAIRAFWEIVDDKDYPVQPEAEEETEE